MVFGNYSKYYNLLYRDKDYDGEASYIHDLIHKNSENAESILDLGCGTGRHDLLLREKGYNVVGVDNSDFMLEEARRKIREIKDRPNTLAFEKGDIRSIRLGKKFDVVVSLFHVMSYQVSNEDILSAFTTARAHMKDSGIFIFDCWYGPAVFASRPEVRIKRINDSNLSLTRIAEPVIDVNANTVDVKYWILLRENANGKSEELYETHKMRYYFIPEIIHYLATVGFDYRSAYSWMHVTPPDEKNWGAVFIAKPT